MKVTLDLAQLLRDGRITEEEYRKFSALATREGGSVAFNILIAFGVTAVAGAALAMMPNAVAGLTIGALLMAAGLSLLIGFPAWIVLGNICVLVAALMFGGGALILMGGTIVAYLLLAAIFFVGSILARSALLMMLSVLAIVGAVGAGTYYSHALYEIVVTRPLLTIIVCAALALIALQVSKRLRPEFERLAVVAARTALFLANMGFWVGSLWGDRPDWVVGGLIALPSAVFSLGWAAGLIGVGLWAIRDDRRWALNVCAVFGAIHFYTQWFEHLSATPATVLAAGLATLGAALVLWKWNTRAGAPALSPSGKSAA
jgi:iron complex transport system permease protein